MKLISKEEKNKHLKFKMLDIFKLIHKQIDKFALINSDLGFVYI